MVFFESIAHFERRTFNAIQVKNILDVRPDGQTTIAWIVYDLFALINFC